MRKDRESAATQFVEKARSQVGYRALPMRQSVFGQAVGYAGQTWNGSFVEWVIRETGTDLPPMINTTAALAALMRADRFFRVPKIGDVMFLETSADGDFGQPAVGVVTDVSEWGRMRAVKAVLGQVGSPAPRGSNDPTGVFERVYYETDVLGFARPGGRTKFRVPEHTAENVKTVMRLSAFQYGKSNKSVEILQLALGNTVGLRDAVRGKLDAQTKSAYAAWQRRVGMVGSDADGTVDMMSLERLGNATGLFTVKD